MMMQQSPNNRTDLSTTFAPGTRLAVVAAEWNAAIMDALLAGADRALHALDFPRENLSVFRCPGSFEIPVVAKACAESGRFDAIVALGCVIRGETYHFELVSNAASEGLMQVMLTSGVPCLMGVLTTDTLEQAEARAGEGPENKGWECVMAAAELLRTMTAIRSGS